MKSKILKKLVVQYSDKKIPKFTYKLDKQEISSHPCFNCLRETELAVNRGYWKKMSKPIYYWYEMCDAESKDIKKYLRKLKPKTILEVGCGSGRIINILLSIKYPKKIYTVDSDSRMVKIIKPLFKKYKNVYIINKNVKIFLKTKKKFDMAICMMSTLGNIDNLKILRQIASNSKNFIFTVYDKKYYKLRKDIYLSKGHKSFLVKDKIYYFRDCWIKGLKSKSYTKEELEHICKSTGKKFKIKKISRLLFLVYIYS